MKIILTGSTGFIGGAVLSQCLDTPAITSIVVLTRRALPKLRGTENPKLKVVIMEDFNSYPESVLEDLSSADGCIWSMGGMSSPVDKALDFEYPLSFLSAITKLLQAQGGKFRYVHLSGGFVRQDQETALWFMEDIRKLKGLAEVHIAGLPEKAQIQGKLETYVVRPLLVVPKDGIKSWVSCVTGPSVSIQVGELAAAMVDVALNGSETQIMDNAFLVSRGRNVLDNPN